jgi:hypothetical protein
MALWTVNPWLDHRHDVGFLDTGAGRPRAGQRKGILEARTAIPKQHLFFETPSPSSRSWGAAIFYKAGSTPCAFQRV